MPSPTVNVCVETAEEAFLLTCYLPKSPQYAFMVPGRPLFSPSRWHILRNYPPEDAAGQGEQEERT
jgi:hypothetical protein